MSRPLIKSHKDVLAAVLQLAATHNSEEVTFVKMAEVTGLSPAALVKRFKTKKQLLLAATAFGYERMIISFLNAGKDVSDPIEKIQSGLCALAGTVDSDDAIGHGVAFLQMNISDPAFNEIAKKGFETLQLVIEQYLKSATSTDQLLKDTDTKDLARVILTMYNGTLITWGIFREDELSKTLRYNILHAVKTYRAK